MAKARESGVVAGVQFGLYLLLCVNFRAVAQADIGVALISDAAIAAMQFFVLRSIARADEPTYLFTGYVLGSVLGTAAGIHLSKTYL